mmetsp:Transcript_8726/g.9294  ORF Transcript_8726/g.9294 Transcript_8726/m.9294 type:complete len:197 (-) Transcript_8726:72-662(-)
MMNTSKRTSIGSTPIVAIKTTDDVTDDKVLMPEIISCSGYSISSSTCNDSVTSNLMNTEKYYHNDDIVTNTNNSTGTASTYFDRENNCICKKSLTVLRNDNDNTNTNLIHPEKDRMKSNRRDKTASFGIVGGVAGTFLFPVVGTVAGATIVGYSTNKIMKKREQKVQQKWERDQYQKSCQESSTYRNSINSNNVFV